MYFRYVQINNKEHPHCLLANMRTRLLEHLGANWNDKLLPAIGWKNVPDKASSPPIGFRKTQLKLWLADKGAKTKKTKWGWHLGLPCGLARWLVDQSGRHLNRGGGGGVRGGEGGWGCADPLSSNLCCRGDQLLAIPDSLKLLRNWHLSLGGKKLIHSSLQTKKHTQYCYHVVIQILGV